MPLFVSGDELPPSDLTVRPPTVGEAVNNTANVIYSAVPWGAALKSKYLLAVKLGSLGVKSLTPTYEAFGSSGGKSQTQADLLNLGIVLVEGVDPEDIVKEIVTRGYIEQTKDYVFGGRRGSIQVTHSFYHDP